MKYVRVWIWKVLVADLQAKKNQIIEDILKNVSTGSASDGKIFVYKFNEAYDIRTKRTDDTYSTLGHLKALI